MVGQGVSELVETNVPMFRNFLIEESFEIYSAAMAANDGDLKRPTIVNALHFMQEVELVHAKEVDHATLDQDTFDTRSELEVFIEHNQKRGDLINYIWQEIKKGNITVIRSVAKLELEHAEEHGISDLSAKNSIDEVGRPFARLYVLDQFGNLKVPDAVPSDE